MAKTTPKIIYYRDETARKLIKGINTVADVVKVRPVVGGVVLSLC